MLSKCISWWVSFLYYWLFAYLFWRNVYLYAFTTSFTRALYSLYSLYNFVLFKIVQDCCTLQDSGVCSGSPEFPYEFSNQFVTFWKASCDFVGIGLNSYWILHGIDIEIVLNITLNLGEYYPWTWDVFLSHLWNLSSLSRDWTWALGSESTKSKPLDHWGIPRVFNYLYQCFVLLLNVFLSTLFFMILL